MKPTIEVIDSPYTKVYGPLVRYSDHCAAMSTLQSRHDTLLLQLESMTATCELLQEDKRRLATELNESRLQSLGALHVIERQDEIKRAVVESLQPRWDGKPKAL